MGHDHQPGSQVDENTVETSEVADGVVVLTSVRTLEASRESSPPFAHVAAVAATGFVAGAATAAVLGRRLARSQSRRGPLAPSEARPLRQGGVEVLAAQRFIVDVHPLVRR
jgi:hypothetical protein